MMEQTNWARMVSLALETDRGFEDLLNLLKPKLELLSKLICDSCYQCDALQIARIKIWEVLPKVTNGQKANPEAFLIRCAVNAMCRWVTQNKQNLALLF